MSGRTAVRVKLITNQPCSSHFLRCLSHSHQDNIIYARDNIARDDKDEIVKRIGEIADGVFQFSDIHEHGGNCSVLLS